MELGGPVCQPIAAQYVQIHPFKLGNAKVIDANNWLNQNEIYNV